MIWYSIKPVGGIHRKLVTPEEQAERANELVDDYCRLQERVR